VVKFCFFVFLVYFRNKYIHFRSSNLVRTRTEPTRTGSLGSVQVLVLVLRIDVGSVLGSG
jgi:hypothetical protein